MSTPRTLVAKIWDEHVVAELGGGYELLFVDRCYLHDLSGPISLRELKWCPQNPANRNLD